MISIAITVNRIDRNATNIKALIFLEGKILVSYTWQTVF